MKILLSHPSIAPHIKQNVLAYHEADVLCRFYTTFYDHPQNALAKNLRRIPSISTEIKRRSFTELPIEKFGSRPWPEFLRIAASRWANVLTADRIWEWAETGFDHWVAKSLFVERPDVVHTYEHAALATLKAARKLGIFTIYEQPSAHHCTFSAILNRQIAAFPEIINDTLKLKTDAKSAKRNARRDEELKLADMILCNSTFTQKTLVKAGISAAKIKMLPLGFPIVKAKPRSIAHKPVIFLHAGNQSLTKASHIVYEAWRKCNFLAHEAELWLVGKMALPERMRMNLPGKVFIRPNVPHHEMQAIYATVDVLLSPSLADGFGMVITEAMASGIPVIASNQCCGPDMITHDQNGWIVPAGDRDILAHTMRQCVKNRESLQEKGDKAAQKAHTWQWTDYRKALVILVEEQCRRV